MAVGEKQSASKTTKRLCVRAYASAHNTRECAQPERGTCAMHCRPNTHMAVGESAAQAHAHGAMRACACDGT